VAQAAPWHRFPALEDYSMVVIDALLVLAMLFFLFLPITDRRTVRMKLAMLCALLGLFAVSVTRTQPQVQLAGVASTR